MSRALSQFFDVGFHGDKFLMDFVEAAARRSVQFVETGANVGSTLCYFAARHPLIRCYSCEPDAASCQFARRKAQGLKNARVCHQSSPEFLATLVKEDPSMLTRKETIFWLDSHGWGFPWPLCQEVEFVTRNFAGAWLFIDDFKVPGQSQFLYDEYDGQVCAFETIANSMKPAVDYRLYYPKYTEKTSLHHPLKGWVMIEFGQSAPLEIPNGLADKIFMTSYVRG
ncbi:MAG: hypothetical protein ABSA47_05905 [Verrucomicrobiota bacterium]